MPSDILTEKSFVDIGDTADTGVQDSLQILSLLTLQVSWGSRTTPPARPSPALQQLECLCALQARKGLGSISSPPLKFFTAPLTVCGETQKEGGAGSQKCLFSFAVDFSNDGGGADWDQERAITPPQAQCHSQRTTGSSDVVSHVTGWRKKFA